MKGALDQVKQGAGDVAQSALKSLENFGSEVFDNQLRAADYVSFVTTLILGMFAVAFAGALVFAGRARKRRLAMR